MYKTLVYTVLAHPISKPCSRNWNIALHKSNSSTEWAEWINTPRQDQGLDPSNTVIFRISLQMKCLCGRKYVESPVVGLALLKCGHLETHENKLASLWLVTGKPCTWKRRDTRGKQRRRQEKKQTQENELVFQEKSCDLVPSLYLELQLKGKGKQKEHLTVNKKIFGGEWGLGGRENTRT